MNDPVLNSASIDTDLYCARCGYNLRTLAADGICPECAWPVGESILNRYGADLKWLRHIRRGLTILFVTGILAVLVTICIYTVVPRLVVPSRMRDVLRLASLLVLLCSAVGVFLVTRRPVYVRFGNLVLLGRAARVLIVCTTAAVLLFPFVLHQTLLNNSAVYSQAVLLAGSVMMLLGCSWQVALFAYICLVLSRFDVRPWIWCILAVSLALGSLAITTAEIYIYFHLEAGGIRPFNTPVYRLTAVLRPLTHLGLVLSATVYYHVCRSRVSRLIANQSACE